VHLARQGLVNLDPLAETSTHLLIRHPGKLTGDSAGSKKTSGAARTRCDGAPAPLTFGRIYTYF